MNSFAIKNFVRSLPLTRILVFGIFFLNSISWLEAQQFQSVTAKSALEFIESRFGADSAKWICELRATGGQPQPSQWEVITYNARSPSLLHRFLVSPGYAQDGGPEIRRYPAEVPAGYFNSADLGLDSMAAFTIAEAEARKFRIGFDSCDYFLRVREYSRETVWRLQLVDATHRLVGTIFISGGNGEVLRTVWVQRSPNGHVQYTDSAAPEFMAYTGIAGDGDLPDRNLTLPPDTGLSAPPSFPPLSRTPEPPMLEIPSQSPPLNIPTNPSVPSPAIPSPSVTTAPPSGSIFKQFPREGGGDVVKTPDPTIPVDPGPSSAIRPPIDIPSTGGKSSGQRIPPPPVPGQ